MGKKKYTPRRFWEGERGEGRRGERGVSRRKATKIGANEEPESKSGVGENAFFILPYFSVFVFHWEKVSGTFSLSRLKPLPPPLPLFPDYRIAAVETPAAIGSSRSGSAGVRYD